MRQFDRVGRDVPHLFVDDSALGHGALDRDAAWRRRLALIGMTVMAFGVLLGLGVTVHVAGSTGEISCGPAWTGTPHPAETEVFSASANDDSECAAARRARGGPAGILLLLGGAMTGVAVSGRRNSLSPRE